MGVLGEFLSDILCTPLYVGLVLVPRSETGVRGKSGYWFLKGVSSFWFITTLWNNSFLFSWIRETLVDNIDGCRVRRRGFILFGERYWSVNIFQGVRPFQAVATLKAALFLSFY